MRYVKISVSLKGVGEFVKTVIYIDVLFLINLIMNTFIYSLTAFALKKEIHILKSALASLLGALYAVFMFFPELRLFYCGLLKILFLFIPCGILFGFSDFKALVKNTLVCFAVSMCLCGSIWLLIAALGAYRKLGAVVSNGILYLDLNPLFLLGGLILSAFSLIFFQVLREREYVGDNIYRLEISYKDKTYILDALCDTGCRLESSDGLPAVIAEGSIFGESFRELLGSDLIALTHTTVSSISEAMPAFIPDRITCRHLSCTAVIGISSVGQLDAGGRFNAVMNPKVLEYGKKFSIKKTRKESCKNEQAF